MTTTPTLANHGGPCPLCSHDKNTLEDLIQDGVAIRCDDCGYWAQYDRWQQLSQQRVDAQQLERLLPELRKLSTAWADRLIAMQDVAEMTRGTDADDISTLHDQGAACVEKCLNELATALDRCGVANV